MRSLNDLSKFLTLVLVISKWLQNLHPANILWISRVSSICLCCSFSQKQGTISQPLLLPLLPPKFHFPSWTVFQDWLRALIFSMKVSLPSLSWTRHSLPLLLSSLPHWTEAQMVQEAMSSLGAEKCVRSKKCPSLIHLPAQARCSVHQSGWIKVTRVAHQQLASALRCKTFLHQDEQQCGQSLELSCKNRAECAHFQLPPGAPMNVNTVMPPELI